MIRYSSLRKLSLRLICTFYASYSHRSNQSLLHVLPLRALPVEQWLLYSKELGPVLIFERQGFILVSRWRSFVLSSKEIGFATSLKETRQTLTLKDLDSILLGELGFSIIVLSSYFILFSMVLVISSVESNQEFLMPLI